MGRRRLPALAATVAVGGMTLLALLARAGGLDPDSLWLDDQWVAVLVTGAPIPYVLTGGFPCPPGFILVLRAVAALLGAGEWQLQALPLLAGLAAIPLLGWVAYRATGDLSLGVIAAAFLAGNDTLAVYSLRVKPFALDALATVLLLALAVEVLRAGRPRTFAFLALAAMLLPLLSFPALLVGGVLVNLVAVARLRERRQGARPFAAWAMAFDVVALAIWALTIRGRGNLAVHEHWADFYLPLGDAGAMPAFLGENALRPFTGAFPAGIGWVALAVPVGVAALLLRRRDRALGAAVIGIYAAMFTLSALSLYPLGGGRTDLFSYPLAILAAVFAISAAAGRAPAWRWAGPVLASLVLVQVAFRLAATSYSYPVSGAAAVVERAGEILAEDDGLIVYPWSNWAVGHYGRWPVEIDVADDSTNAFYVRPVRRHVLVLRESRQGVRFQEEPSALRGQLLPFLSSAPARLVYVADRGPRPPHEWIVEMTLGAGYRLEHQELHDGAILMVFRR